MKVIIAGSRNLDDIFYVDAAVYLANWKITEIVSGGARGIDKAAIEYAKQNKLNFVEFMADWESQGKAAGAIRNAKMAEYGDALIAIWDGASPGTLNMINTMVKLKKPVYVYCPR